MTHQTTNISFSYNQYLEYSDQSSDVNHDHPLPYLEPSKPTDPKSYSSSELFQASKLPLESNIFTDYSQLYQVESKIDEITWNSDFSNFLNPLEINHDESQLHVVSPFKNLPSSPINYDLYYDENDSRVNSQDTIYQPTLSSDDTSMAPTMFITIKFIHNLFKFQNMDKIMVRGRKRKLHHFEPKTDIYDIGPKILPRPFTSEFYKLKLEKFKPLKELKELEIYQLPKGIKDNYSIREKSSKKIRYTTIQPNESSMTKKCRIALPRELDSEVKRDRYYSRLNIYELSHILGLNHYDISLTKLIASSILEIFGNYCGFNLGYQTWVRDTTLRQRTHLIDQLYSYSSCFYPELDRLKLEIIIRRGSYTTMQTRLRRDRRCKEKKLLS